MPGRRTLLAACAALTMAREALAQPPLAQPPLGRGGGGQSPSVQLTFTTAEQARITAWLVANAGSLQPLPPGIARNLARGRPLPPGIARRAAPQALVSQLLPRPGYEVLVIGTAVVLARVGTALVQDIVDQPGRGR
jgi:hypothetical protein